MLTPYENRPIRLFVSVLGVVFAVEAAVMFILPMLMAPNSHGTIFACLDATLLTAILSPLLWLLIVSPLRKLAVMRQAVLGAALKAQEDERRRIARELHDGLGQSLTALLVGMRTVEEATSDENAKQLIRDLRRMGGETHDEVRRIARGLRPVVLDDVGMVPAIERLLQDTRVAHGIDIELRITGEQTPQLAAEAETALYRIVQEAMLNAIRHGRATYVLIELRFWQKLVELQIHDNGSGFDPHAVSNCPQGLGTFGIDSMRERARLLGGDLQIESAGENGTVVTVRIPV